MTEIPDYLKSSVSLDIQQSIIRVDMTQHRRSDIQTFIRQLKERYNRPFAVENVDLSQLSNAPKNKNVTSDEQASYEFNKQAMRELIQEAAEYRASDIHIVVSADVASIQFEIDGALRQLPTITREKGVAMIRAAYQALATVCDASFMLGVFQNASIPGSEFSKDVNIAGVRIQRGPCFPYDKFAEFMTMRIQYHGGGHHGRRRLCSYPFPKAPSGNFDFATMGFDQKQVRLLNQLMSMPDGIVLVTGPVGSGKSTTIFNMLMTKLQRSPHLRLITVEDPIEVPIEGAVQLAVKNVHSDSERSRAFQEAMTVMLRMAPRWMFFGEIRDDVVAHVALEAAISGHGIFTTLHLSDPFQWADRLEGMDRSGLLRKSRFCDHRQVRGVLGQRLLSKLCDRCSLTKPLHFSDGEVIASLLAILSTWGDITRVRFKGRGCEHCGYSGLAGRLVVAEIVITTNRLMKNFIEKNLEAAREDHMQSDDSDMPMIERATRLAMAGLVDPFEVLERVDVIRPKHAKLG